MAAAAGIEAVRDVATGVARPSALGCNVAFTGEVSGTRATRLEEELMFGADNAESVVVNLSRVTHLSVAAMRSLVRAHKLTTARGARFDVQAMSLPAIQAFARAGVRWTSPQPDQSTSRPTPVIEGYETR
jgi:anti-anti-sigma regulatory factor